MSPTASTSSSSTSSTSIDLKTKLKVIESILIDELRAKWVSREEEWYDLQDNPFYNAWAQGRKQLRAASCADPLAIQIPSPL